MSIAVNDSIQNFSPKPENAWYHKGFVNGSSIPYASVAEVNATIQSVYRSKGLTVLISVGGENIEYWYKDGLLDGDLVEKPIRITAGPNVTVTKVGNVYTVTANVVTVGDSSTQEVFTATGDFSKTFQAGVIITSFVLVPADNNSYTISVGTTPGGTDLYNQVSVSGVKPPPFEYLNYFKNPETWYFTGVPSGTMVIIMYRPQIILT